MSLTRGNEGDQDHETASPGLWLLSHESASVLDLQRGGGRWRVDGLDLDGPLRGSLLL